MHVIRMNTFNCQSRSLGRHYDSHFIDKEAEVQRVSLTCLCLPRSLVEELGLNLGSLPAIYALNHHSMKFLFNVYPV